MKRKGVRARAPGPARQKKLSEDYLDGLRFPGAGNHTEI